MKVYYGTKIFTNNNADLRLYYDIRNKLKKNFRKIIHRIEYSHWKIVALKKIKETRKMKKYFKTF